MSRKFTLLTTLALMLTLEVGYGSYLVAHPPKTKGQPVRIHAVNSISSDSFTMTNSTALNALPVTKP